MSTKSEKLIGSLAVTHEMNYSFQCESLISILRFGNHLSPGSLFSKHERRIILGILATVLKYRDAGNAHHLTLMRGALIS